MKNSFVLDDLFQLLDLELGELPIHLSDWHWDCISLTKETWFLVINLFYACLIYLMQNAIEIIKINFCWRILFSHTSAPE